jgi:phosphoribosylglycinamide formyltransferase 1
VSSRELGSLPALLPAPARGAVLPARLVVLASGSGSTLQALLDAGREPSYGAHVVGVGSDKPQSRALQRARDAGVPAFAVALERGADRAAWNLELADAVAAC